MGWRQPESRARHRARDGAVGPTPEWRRTLRGHSRAQAALRPDRHPGSGCHHRRRSDRASEGLQAPRADRDRGRGRPLRRVRLLRAGVPLEGPHPHTRQGRVVRRGMARPRHPVISTSHVSCTATTTTPGMTRARRTHVRDRLPVLINTGKAASTARGPVTRSGSRALSVAGALPVRVMKAATTVGRAIAGNDAAPECSSDLPGGFRRWAPGTHGCGRRRRSAPGRGAPFRRASTA